MQWWKMVETDAMKMANWMKIPGKCGMKSGKIFVFGVYSKS